MRANVAAGWLLACLLVFGWPSAPVKASTEPVRKAAEIFATCRSTNDHRQCFLTAMKMVCPKTGSDATECENRLTEAVSEHVLACFKTALKDQKWSLSSSDWGVAIDKTGTEAEIDFVREDSFLHLEYFTNAGGAPFASVFRRPETPPNNPWGVRISVNGLGEAIVNGVKASTLPGIAVKGRGDSSTPLPGTQFYAFSAKNLYDLMLKSPSIELKSSAFDYSASLDGFRRLARQMEDAYGACGGEIE